MAGGARTTLFKRGRTSFLSVTIVLQYNAKVIPCQGAVPYRERLVMPGVVCHSARIVLHF
jgi:hypothetical protein